MGWGYERLGSGKRIDAEEFRCGGDISFDSLGIHLTVLGKGRGLVCGDDVWG